MCFNACDHTGRCTFLLSSFYEILFFIKRFKYSKLQDHGSNQYFLYKIMVQTHKMEIMNIETGNTYIDV